MCVRLEVLLYQIAFQKIPGLAYLLEVVAEPNVAWVLSCQKFHHALQPILLG